MGVDFMSYNKKVDWIITNPPFSKFTDFLTKSCEISNNIVFLIYINSLFTKKRVRIYSNAGFRLKEILILNDKIDKSYGWVQCGLQLGAIYLQKHTER